MVKVDVVSVAPSCSRAALKAWCVEIEIGKTLFVGCEIYKSKGYARRKARSVAAKLNCKLGGDDD